VSFSIGAARAAALGLLFALAGCSMSWLPWAGSAPEEACPQTVILHPLANTASFAPGGERRPEGVAFYGILSDVESKCRYGDGTVRVNLNVIVIGQRGPAGKGAAVDFDYFVAVVGPDNSILSKHPFRVHIVFPAGKIRAGVSDRIEEVIPLEGKKGSELTLDLGFQQSPEVVEFYRHFRGR
jgi:hypothetical protein